MKNVYKLLDIYSQKKTTLLLALIIFLGFLLRSYQVINRTGFLFNDSSRDILVAKHIATYNDPIVKPLVGLGNTDLENSYLYFLLLSIVWKIFPNPLSIIYVFILLGTLQILINYKIGRILHGQLAGISLAFFTAIGSIFIQSSQSVFQPNIIPIFISLTVYYLLKIINDENIYNFKKTKNNLLLLTLASFTALYLHYSIVFILPALIIYTLIALIKIKKYHGTNKLLIPITGISIAILSWILSSDNLFFIYKMINNFHSLKLTFSINNTFIKLLRNFNTFFRNIFPLINKNLLNDLTLLILIIASFFVASKKDKKNQLLLITLLLSFLTTTIFNVEDIVLGYQLMPFYTIFLITIVNTIFIFFSSKKIFLVASLLIIGFLLSNKNYFSLKKITNSSFNEGYDAAKLILDDYQNSTEKINFKEDLVAYAVEYSSSDWFNASIYYPLGVVTNTKLTQVVSFKKSANNINWINKNGKFIYILCRSNNNQINHCLDYINDRHPKAKFIDKRKIPINNTTNEYYNQDLILKFIQF